MLQGVEAEASEHRGPAHRIAGFAAGVGHPGHDIGLVGKPGVGHGGVDHQLGLVARPGQGDAAGEARRQAALPGDRVRRGVRAGGLYADADLYGCADLDCAGALMV